ncbi:MAG: sn-glycerol-3-phosphate ABC transporter ATP-binding protein UgpC [Acidimicrobiales bacterium]
MSTIQLRSVVKRYPNGYEAVRGIDLDVAENEFVVLVGPSGCGKTTLLRMVAGLEEISEGDLLIGDQRANDIAPMDRDIAMVFQNYALYPHMTVAQNIGFALKLRKLSKVEIRRRVEDAARLMGLTDLLGSKPAQLSGGQRQRVAMGRAIVREPVAFLMDEPLSNLDARLRVQMRAEIRRLQRRLGVATLYVTHDQTEAMTMGDRVAVLRAGTVRQFASPQQLFDHPDDSFVANFIGSPSMNLYVASLTDEARTLRLGSQNVEVGDDLVAARPGLARYHERALVVGFRPEHVVAGAPTDFAHFVADVDLVEPLGSSSLVHFRIDAARIDAADTDAPAETPDSAGEGVAVLDAEASIIHGQRAPFAVDPRRLHFFDAESGLAIRD